VISLLQKQLIFASCLGLNQIQNHYLNYLAQISLPNYQISLHNLKACEIIVNYTLGLNWVLQIETWNIILAFMLDFENYTLRVQNLNIT
jgi:hypothetical protein